MPSTTSSESESDSDPDATSSFEGIRRYSRGTFYPVRIGECLHKAWRVQSKLGFGRFCTAWACVAINEHASHPPTHAIKLTRSDDDHWRDEAEVLEKLGPHPCVIRLHSSFEVFASRRSFGCVVTSLHGQSLGRLIRRGVEIDQATLLGIALDAAAGLAHVHAGGYIHTDVKPENILLHPALSSALLGEPPNLRVYVSRRRAACTVPRPYRDCAARGDATGQGSFCVVADLGNAERIGLFPPEPGSIQATCYRAPEVVMHLPHDERADVFGLGIVMYEAMTHTYLVETMGDTERDESVAHLSQLRALLGPLPEWMILAASPVFTRDELTKGANPSSSASETEHLLATELGGVVRSMLALDPRERPSAAAVFAALSGVDTMRA
jgi:serine/threonine protein kinase